MSDSENSSKPLKLVAKRLGKGLSSELELDAIEGKVLGQGMTGIVSHVSVGRGRRERKRVDQKDIEFAYKRLKSANQEGEYDKNLVDSFVTRIQKVHERLLKLPHGREYTPNTVRLTQEGMLMTDLSEGGKYLAFSWNDIVEENIDYLKAKLRNNPKLQELVWQIDVNAEEWQKEFNRQTEQIALETSEGKIYIPGDAPMIVFKPNNKFQLVVGDLDGVSVEERMNGLKLKENNKDAFEGLRIFIMELVDQVSEPGFLD